MLHCVSLRVYAVTQSESTVCKTVPLLNFPGVHTFISVTFTVATDF